MKKEFIDYIYELRALVQCDIDRLVDELKSDNTDLTTRDEIGGELRTRRSQIFSINETITKYLEIHR